MTRKVVGVLLLLIGFAMVSGVAFAQIETVDKTPAEYVFAAWQPFEGGVMMWWADTDQVWVFTNGDRTIRIYEDIYIEGDPEPDWEDSPEGYHTPIRGFGAIWRLIGGDKGELGWAMAPAIGFDSAARRVSGETLFVQGPGDTLYAVNIADGASLGTWRVVRYY